MNGHRAAASAEEAINDLMISVDAAGIYALTIRNLETECVSVETIEVGKMPEISARIENDKILSCSQNAITF